MALPPRTVVRMTLVAAVVVFCGVQDRVTAAGARRYVALYRAGTPAAIDAVVRPAVRASVERSLTWAGAVVVAGVGAAAVLHRRRR
jgi:hypothetical protein